MRRSVAILTALLATGTVLVCVPLAIAQDKPPETTIVVEGKRFGEEGEIALAFKSARKADVGHIEVVFIIANLSKTKKRDIAPWLSAFTPAGGAGITDDLDNTYRMSAPQAFLGGKWVTEGSLYPDEGYLLRFVAERPVAAAKKFRVKCSLPDAKKPVVFEFATDSIK